MKVRALLLLFFFFFYCRIIIQNDTVVTVMVCVWTSVKYLTNYVAYSDHLYWHLFAFQFCWHWKWCMCFSRVSVNFLIAVLTVSACIFYSYLVVLFNVFATIWSMGNLSSIIFILYCRHYFWQFIFIVIVFVSFWAGNHPSYLATLCAYMANWPCLRG